MKTIPLLVAGLLFVSGCSTTCTDPPSPPTAPTGARKVAVLISTEYAESMDNIYDADAWYDLVHTYCMLRRNGFTDENIWVLYAYGKDGFYHRRSSCSTPKPANYPPATSGPEVYYQQPFCEGLHDPDGAALSVKKAITDIPTVVGKGSDVEEDGELRLERFFRCLEKGCNPNFEFGLECGTHPYIHPLTANDFLYVWWRGHGVPFEPTGGKRTTILSLTGGKEISAETLVDWIASTSAKRSVLAMESCHSGCTKDVMTAIATSGVLLASSACSETSNKSYKFDVYHGVWSFWLAGSLQGSLPNGYSNELGPPEDPITIGLSAGGPIEFTFDEAAKATTTLFPSQNPKKADQEGFAGATKMDNPDPTIPVSNIQ
jgi:hypothetical protein